MAGRIIDVFAFKGSNHNHGSLPLCVNLGFHIFLPKYIEINFGIPQYKVNQLLGKYKLSIGTLDLKNE